MKNYKEWAKIFEEELSLDIGTEEEKPEEDSGDLDLGLEDTPEDSESEPSEEEVVDDKEEEKKDAEETGMTITFKNLTSLQQESVQTLMYWLQTMSNLKAEKKIIIKIPGSDFKADIQINGSVPIDKGKGRWTSEEPGDGDLEINFS